MPLRMPGAGEATRRGGSNAEAVLHVKPVAAIDLFEPPR